jgi:hypothetical protein
MLRLDLVIERISERSKRGVGAGSGKIKMRKLT